MTLTRKIVLRDAAPLVGTEIAVYVDGRATELTDGYTFGMGRVFLPSGSSSVTVEWGDGRSDIFTATTASFTHVYKRVGVYRIRVSDDITSIAATGTTNELFLNVYPSMIREVRSTSTKIITIPRTAFANACNLRYVDFRDSSITALAPGAFSGCSGLTTLKGFSKIEKLYSTVFAGCTGLPERVCLPGVKDIQASVDYSPFLRTNIKEFHFAAENEAAIKALRLYQDTNGNLGVQGGVCVFDL